MVNWLLAQFHWLLVIGGLLLLIAACLGAWVIQRQPWAWRDDPPEYDPDDWQVPLPPIEDEPGDEWAGALHHIALDFPAPQLARSGGGELHPYEHAFPPVLQLGRPFDGGDKTAARVELHAMSVRNRVEAARMRLAEECGIRYVPMEAIAA